MSLRIIDRPSQGGETLELRTIFLEDLTLAGLQAKIDALSVGTLRQTAVPAGETFVADIQYQTTDVQGNMINYSVMIVLGEWNPT